MQSFTQGIYTVYMDATLDGRIPAAIGMTADQLLVLLCHRRADTSVSFLVLEVQACQNDDCGILQRTERDSCLLCGGALTWAEDTEKYAGEECPDAG